MEKGNKKKKGLGRGGQRRKERKGKRTGTGMEDLNLKEERRSKSCAIEEPGSGEVDECF